MGMFERDNYISRNITKFFLFLETFPYVSEYVYISYVSGLTVPMLGPLSSKAHERKDF